MKKMKYFSCALCLCLLFPLSAAASSIDSVEIYLEDPHTAEVLPEVENSTEPFTEPESETESEPESESESEPESESESESKSESESESESETQSEPATETENKTPPSKYPCNKPGNSEIMSGGTIVKRYRMYNGRPQYRRWNETYRRWVDSRWREMVFSGIKKITLSSGSTKKLKLEVIKPFQASKRVYWKSRKTRIVKAAKNGRIWGKRRGTASVVAINIKTKRVIAKVKVVVR